MAKKWTEVRTKMLLVAAKAADVDVKTEAPPMTQSSWRPEVSLHEKPGPKGRSSTLFEVWRTDDQVPGWGFKLGPGQSQQINVTTMVFRGTLEP